MLKLIEQFNHIVMKREYYNIKEMHPNYLVIIRKDNCGEIYSEDANIFSKLFSIKKDKDGVIRFSWNLLDIFLRLLIHNGIKVAVRG